MLLSEMFGVERDADFMVEGYAGTFKIILHCNGAERLLSKYPGESFWQLAKSEIICTAIFLAPSGIIHLPPPLTDNQIEHLKALWAIGGQWLAKDASGAIFCYKAKPQKKDGCEWTTWESDEFIDITDFVTSVSGLVSWSDSEPYDIGKAIGTKR